MHETSRENAQAFGKLTRNEFWPSREQEFKRQQYFDRKVRHLVALGMNSAVRDRPEDPKTYLAEFFEERTKFY